MIEVCSQHCDRTGYCFDSTIEIEHYNVVINTETTYRMKIYTELKFSDMERVGQIRGIKYEQILIFEFHLYKLSLRRHS